jgi:hypothetical protein
MGNTNALKTFKEDNIFLNKYKMSKKLHLIKVELPSKVPDQDPHCLGCSGSGPNPHRQYGSGSNIDKILKITLSH